MSAAALVAQADPGDVERIREARSLRPSASWLWMVVAAVAAVVAVPWAWQEAGEHGHRTALVVWSLVGVAPFVAVRIRSWRRGRLTPGPRRREETLRRRSIGAVVYVATTAVEWSLAWWLLQQEGRCAALALGLVIPLSVVSLFAPFFVRVAPALIALRRIRARGRDARAILAERELDEIAWTISNRKLQNGAALRVWIDREHPELSDDIQVVPRVPAKERGLTGIFAVWADDLTPGLRRQLPDGGKVTVQPVEDDRDVVLTTAGGEVLKVSGLPRPIAMSHDWKDHAGTVLAARIATGPAVIANAIYVGTSAAKAYTTGLLVVGGGEQSVPIGSTGDRKVRLGDFTVQSDRLSRAGVPQLELVVPPPPASAAILAQPQALSPAQRKVAEAVEVLVPGVGAALKLNCGVEALQLSDADSGRTVQVVPLTAGSQFGPPENYEPGLLFICPDLDLVAVDTLVGSSDRADTIAAIAALLRGDEKHLVETVHQSDRGVFSKPKHGTKPVQATGWQLGPLTVWLPVPRDDA